jgi:hypothetical protein
MHASSHPVKHLILDFLNSLFAASSSSDMRMFSPALVSIMIQLVVHVPYSVKSN